MFQSSSLPSADSALVWLISDSRTKKERGRGDIATAVATGKSGEITALASYFKKNCYDMVGVTDEKFEISML